MKISLFQGILYGVFGFAALVGLFVFATYSSNTGGDSVGPVVVWGTLPAGGIQTALAAITQAETALKNVSYVEKNEATLPADLATAIATGSAPDLVLASQEELLSLQKFLTPIPLTTLSARVFSDTFVQGADIFTAPGAGYWGIPFLADPLVLFSNRAILASKGVARPPATWEALVGLVPNIAVLTPSRQVTRGLIALGAYDNVRNARGVLSALFLQQNIPVSGYAPGGFLSANLGASSVGSRAPGPSVLGFYTQFADPSKVSYTWNASLPNSQQMFLAGDLALYLGYASEARYFSAANPNLDFDVSPLPQPATAPLKSAYGLFYAFMFPRGAQNPSGTYQVAVLLTGNGAQTVAAGAPRDAPAHHPPPFQDQHPEPGLDQVSGAGQAVVAGADDDDVVF
mgnify:FL=1